ncbi:MAG: aconitate hydratase AcnA [Cyanobacteria bacterium SZAS TMP-1]|nr:aconitate hydratase AcnA [Cyanobacteria bacterium SZAS TMP-1]
MLNSFRSNAQISVGSQKYDIFRLGALTSSGCDISTTPYSIRILLENLLRNEDGVTVTKDDIVALANWKANAGSREIAFRPSRVVLQDFTGVPALVDLAAMREAIVRLGEDPQKINPLIPVELVIDHSVQVDAFGSDAAFAKNVEFDYVRNKERYAFLRWGQQAFRNFKVVPPNTGIVHQVNLEYLSRVVFSEENGASRETKFAYPDTCVGTDSHTPMVNGLGVLAWGVGGIEAEAAMLGQPISMLIPHVLGVHVTGALKEGTTATDLVLTITERLRKKGVVGKFVEFFGPGVSLLGLADRATIGNMSPEYGCTCTMFPPDQVTLNYLRLTGRSEHQIELVERYMKEQGLFHTAESVEPSFSEILELDLASVEPCIAGPGRPQDRIKLSAVPETFRKSLPALAPPKNVGVSTNLLDDQYISVCNGTVVIAAITSCTNTSNPSVMLAAGLLAKKAVEKGLTTKRWVKTSLAPGSKTVTEYLQKANLTQYLDQLGFNLVGYGCTTCIGNSGPLDDSLSQHLATGGIVACSVLSGNRNFEGRIHPEVRANFLMSPPLVVAYALAGSMEWRHEEPLGKDKQGNAVLLKDIWPTEQEISEVLQTVTADIFASSYKNVFEGDERWQSMEAPKGNTFIWDDSSTYVRQPPYFLDMETEATKPVSDIKRARALAYLGDSVTTDHISPAGNIKLQSPAGEYLQSKGVTTENFNSYGARRGNHEVMVRGTFGNVRIRNLLAPGTEGGVTMFLLTNQVLPIYDAAMQYKSQGVPLMILAGKEYGAGSSRDWAAKGPYLQGVKFVLAESYERIHRSNLVGMGILPLEFEKGENAASLQLNGRETFDVIGLPEWIGQGLTKGRTVHVRATAENGEEKEFSAAVRIDTPQEVLYFRYGGILQFVLRQLCSGNAPLAKRGGMSSAQPSLLPSKKADEKATQSSIESFPASDSPAY